MSNTSRLITRRKLLALMSAALLSRNSLRAQDGMASRGLAPAPRPKPSGKSFGLDSSTWLHRRDCEHRQSVAR